MKGSTLAQLIEVLRSTATTWRAGNQEHHRGVVMVFEGEVYGWKNGLRDPACERPDAVGKTGLAFNAEVGDDYNCAKAWIAINPDVE